MEAAAYKASLKALRVTERIQLYTQLGNLKRIRAAHLSGSLADTFFRQAWCSVSEFDVRAVALSTVAQCLARIHLGAVDQSVFEKAELKQADIQQLENTSFRLSSAGVDPVLCQGLAEHLQDEFPVVPAPAFVELLARQPRAGATRPGLSRLIVVPQESHADHCLLVAIYAVLLSRQYDADPAVCFLAGLSHHLHNAYLPDAGFAGEELLGEQLTPMMKKFQAAALAQLDEKLASEVLAALARVADLSQPEGYAFHAADVLDRVLQMKWHEDASRFTLQSALQDMELVHAGPLQQFQMEVLREAGLC